MFRFHRNKFRVDFSIGDQIRKMLGDMRLRRDGINGRHVDIAKSHGFRHGKRLGLLIRNEDANPFYTTPFMCALYEQEGGELFDVRQAILGHLQQGGDPSPFDRILATKPPERVAAQAEENRTVMVEPGSE